MSASFATERAVLRLRLQANREKLATQLGGRSSRRRPAVHSLFETGDTFPRSITMRLLTNRQNFLLMAAAELFPLLLRHYLKATAQSAQSNNSRRDETG